MNLADKYGELILDDFAYQFEVVSVIAARAIPVSWYRLDQHVSFLGTGAAHNYKT